MGDLNHFFLYIPNVFRECVKRFRFNWLPFFCRNLYILTFFFKMRTTSKIQKTRENDIMNNNMPDTKPCQIFFFFFFFFCLFKATPAAYGDCQARGPIGAVATGLRNSHSSAGSRLCLRPTPQLTATPDP